MKIKQQIDGSNIHFKPMQIEDLELLHKWFQIPHVKQWYARGEIFTHAMIVEKYLPRITDVENIPNFIILYNDISVGYIQIYRLSFSLPEGVNNYDHPIFKEYTANEIAGIDFFIADENFLGKGISSKIMTTFIDTYIKAKFQAVIVDPVVNNHRAIAFFERNGFKKLTSSENAEHVLMIYQI